MTSSPLILRLSRAARRSRAQVFAHLPHLLLVSDETRLPDPCPLARQLPKGSGVILRHRNPRWRSALAAALMQIARSRQLTVLIAQDASLARALRAGLHLSESGRAGAAYGRVPGALLTIAAHSETACWKARLAGADAVVLAPVFPTESHPGRPALGVLRVRLMARRLRIPLYALGGVTSANASRFAGAGLAGLAAVGAFKFKA